MATRTRTALDLEGHVADDGEDAFTAFVTVPGDPSPFPFTNGPARVALGDALAWARGHAPRVTLRVNDALFSAGSEPVGGLPSLPSGLRPRGDAGRHYAAAQRTRWVVEASTCWHGEGRAAVAAALLRGLRVDRRLVRPATASDHRVLRATFTTTCATSVEAHEIAADALRRAWRAVGVEAVSGRDYDASHVEVWRAGRGV